ncbi:MAG: hypothetical protein WCL51_04110 [Bacteroidota bacterium]
MKTIKTSNILLLIFGISIILYVIAHVITSNYYDGYGKNKATYLEIKVENPKPFKYVVINSLYTIKVQLTTAKDFHIEQIKQYEDFDSCKYSLRNDTLYIKTMQYPNYLNFDDLKITIPNRCKSITIGDVKCELLKVCQDTLNINCLKEESSFSLNESTINTVNYFGKSSTLSILSTSKIENLNFYSRGVSRLELDDVIIGNFNLDQDSTEIVLSGKAIKYYLKK